jgi:hypothetical protein
MGVDPARDGAGHADGQGPRLGNLGHTGFGKERRGRERTGAAAGVEGGDFAGLPVEEDPEGVAPDSVHVRARHGQYPGHRDDRVRRVAAALEHLQPGLCGEGMAGGDGPRGSPHVRAVLGRVDGGGHDLGGRRAGGGGAGIRAGACGRHDQQQEEKDARCERARARTRGRDGGELGHGVMGFAGRTSRPGLDGAWKVETLRRPGAMRQGTGYFRATALGQRRDPVILGAVRPACANAEHRRFIRRVRASPCSQPPPPPRRGIRRSVPVRRIAPAFVWRWSSPARTW